MEETKSKFMKVECKGCGNTQVVFDRAKSKVSCMVCDKELVEPTGGRAKVHGEIKRSF
jgi:small subunit ribosomal protein S27e